MALLTARAAADKLGVGYPTINAGSAVAESERLGPKAAIIGSPMSEIDRLLARQQPAARQRPTVPADDESLGGLSARNRLGDTSTRFVWMGCSPRYGYGWGPGLTAVITGDAVRALKLRRGDDAIAIVKSTEVMIARPSKALKRG